MRELIKAGLILDGAMGTELIKRGLRNGESSILWNVEHPDDIWDIHRAYMNAGASVVTANSFGGSAMMLRKYGLEDRMVELNREAVHLAKTATAGRALVLGDIGPCGEFLEPYGDVEPEVLTRAIREQGEALAAAGVDGFIVETMSDPQEVELAIVTLKAYFGLPIVATFSFEKQPTGYQTMLAASPTKAAQVAINAGASCVGANCGSSLSLEDYLVLGEQLLMAAGSVPVLLQPNAGAPVQDGDSFHYSVEPKHFAEWGMRARALGVKSLGGCCGTTPAHIEALVQSVLHG